MNNITVIYWLSLYTLSIIMTGEARKVIKNMTLDNDLVEKMDEARGYEPLSSFVNRTLRKAMDLPDA